MGNIAKILTTCIIALYCTLSVCPKPCLAQGNTSEYLGYMYSGKFGKALEYAKCLKEKALEAGSLSDEMLADSYIGQAQIAMDNYDSAYFYFNKGLEIWSRIDSSDRRPENYKAMYAICNGMGIYSITIDMNYEKAIEYFMAGSQLAEKQKDYINYAILGSNMVIAYALRKDSSGLKYALEIYGYGKEFNDSYIIYTGSSTCAMMYSLKGETAQAKKYAEEAMSIADKYSDEMGIYRLYAEIMAAEGKTKEAQRYYEMALYDIGRASATTAIAIYLSYGNFLLNTEKYNEALEMLDKGINLAEAKHNRIYTYQLHNAKSEAYARLGKYKDALEEYKLFHTTSIDIFNIERERDVNELTRKYENERHERQIQQHNLEMVKKDREMQSILTAFALVLICLLAIWLMYRHKNHLYLQIARQYKETVEKLKATAPNSSEGSKTESRNDKYDDIFERLESLMKNEKIYRELNLTRERVSELMNSNRTYLSQVIKEKTGQSFITYINDFRINEAIEILSDPKNDMPLKALSSHLGFSSITTFYKLFKDKVGMTPAKYREKIIVLSKADNCQN